MKNFYLTFHFKTLPTKTYRIQANGVADAARKMDKVAYKVYSKGLLDKECLHIDVENEKQHNSKKQCARNKLLNKDDYDEPF